MINEKYRDMLYMKRPASKRYTPMSIKDRAGQFAPFKALTGYEESIEETEEKQKKKFQ